MERYVDAIEDFDSALTLDPEIDSSNERRLAQNAQTIAVAVKTIRLNAEDGNAFHGRGSTLADLERYDEALAEYDVALSLDSCSGDAYCDRGRTPAALGRNEKAIADYDVALELLPENAEIWAHRSAAKFSEERYLEAIADCNAALAFNADLPETLALRKTVQSVLFLFTVATVNTKANLGGGPGAINLIVGFGEQGDTVIPVAQTEDGQWLKLACGAWLFASLADNVPLDLGITEHIPNFMEWRCRRTRSETFSGRLLQHGNCRDQIGPLPGSACH